LSDHLPSCSYNNNFEFLKKKLWCKFITLPVDVIVVVEVVNNQQGSNGPTELVFITSNTSYPKCAF